MRRSKLLSIAALIAVCVLTCIAFAACTPADDGKPTITYETGTSDPPAPLTVSAGTKIYPPADPSRDGYRFDGWTLDGVPYVFDRMPEQSITLKASWLKLYALSFDTGDDTLYYIEGEQITLPDDPVKADHKFTGWLSNGEAFTAETMPARDVALTAGWIAARTITFDTSALGISVPAIVEPAGTAISAPAVNVPKKYVTGWLHNGNPYTFTTMPDENITLTPVYKELTNMPSMFIDLENGYPLANVDRITYINSKVTLTNTKDEYVLNGVAAGFRGRGNGSWTDISYDKKGYKIKFDKKQSLFGQAANKHWVILAGANFDDPTMSRNYLAFNMARDVFTNIEHSTIAEWVDIYVNGEYRGVYLLCEHTRVGKGRVDIESEYTVDPEHNGFLIEYDAYGDQPNPDKGETSFTEGINYFRIDGVKYPFTMHSPDPEDYAEEGITEGAYMRQVAYIKDYVQRVYTAALNHDYNTFAELADVRSFVDMYILHELFKNVDCGYSSFYLYKKPDGKLYAGPPWDFDATANIGDRGDRTPQGIYVADSVQTGSANCASELYIELYKTAQFKAQIVSRWKELSPQIKTFLNERMNDTVYAENKAAMGKNYAMYKGGSESTQAESWVTAMKTLKTWFTDRVAWLDGEWR